MIPVVFILQWITNQLAQARVLLDKNLIEAHNMLAATEGAFSILGDYEQNGGELSPTEKSRIVDLKGWAEKISKAVDARNVKSA